MSYINKIGEHWLPRITKKLIMIGSQFIYTFTTSLGQRTLKEPSSETLLRLAELVLTLTCFSSADS